MSRHMSSKCVQGTSLYSESTVHGTVVIRPADLWVLPVLWDKCPLGTIAHLPVCKIHYTDCKSLLRESIIELETFKNSWEKVVTTHAQYEHKFVLTSTEFWMNSSLKSWLAFQSNPQVNTVYNSALSLMKWIANREWNLLVYNPFKSLTVQEPWSVPIAISTTIPGCCLW